MNKVNLVGRLTKDPDIRESGQSQNNASGTSIARFTVAVNRTTKNANGGYDADFINCTAFGKIAEFIGKYFNKGMSIGIVGRIQTGSYTNKDGQRIFTTDIIVENAEFVGNNSDSNRSTSNNNNGGGNRNSNRNNNTNGFMNIPDGVDDEGLPFN